MGIQRLNHAVLYVRDAAAAARFYRDVLGFVEVATMGGGAAVFLRAGESENHHDLGLFSVGQHPPVTHGSPGLYHLAWQVGTLDELVRIRALLVDAGSLVGQSDHGSSKSLYARDLDGIEFEVMWAVPRDAWGEAEKSAPVKPLDVSAELARWSGVRTG